MFVVGTDRVRIVEGRIHPAETEHAVRLDGAALCRERAVAYTFPAREWALGASSTESCPACVEAMAAAAFPPVPTPAYPTDPTLVDTLVAEVEMADMPDLATFEVGTADAVGQLGI